MDIHEISSVYQSDIFIW